MMETIKSQPAPPDFPVRLLFSASAGSLAVCFGAAAWGLLAFFSNSMYQLVAFLIGWVVAVALILPLRPIQKRFALLCAPAVVLGALLSLVLGDVLFSTLYEIRSFEAPAGEALVDSVLRIGSFFASREIILSHVLAAVGSVLGLINSWSAQ